MPNAAIVAAALTDHAARAYALFVGGLDTINHPSIQTPVSSIRVVENGPGGVSSMDFDIWDRGAAFTIGDDTPVSFWDLTNDVCLFRGTVDGWDSKPAFATGRIYSVGCVGVEAWLDWAYVPPGLTYTYSYSLPNVTGILASQYGPGLKAPHQQPGMSLAPFSRAGSFDYPIGNFVRPTQPNNAIIFTSWTSPGGTLRQTLVSLSQAIGWMDSGTGVFGTTEGVKTLVTVDFYLGLRAWEDDPALQPDDYTTLTVTDTVAGAIAATRVSYNVEPGDVEHEVYVDGGNAAGSGFFSDGSGIRGRCGVLTDDTILTVADATQQAANYLAGQSQSVRGTVTLENLAPVATVHAGSLLDLTDAPSGATGTYRIFSIAKTFHGNGRQDWEVGFGGLKPSAVRLMRRFIAMR